MKIRSYFKNSFRILMLVSVCFFYSPNSFAARIDPISNNSEAKGKLTGMVQDLLTLMKKIENLKVVQDTLSMIGDLDKAVGQAIGGVAGGVLGTVNHLTSGVGGIAGGLTDTVGGLTDTVGGLADAVTSGDIGGLVDGVANTASGITNTLDSALTTVDKVVGTATNTINTVTSAATGAINSVSQTVVGTAVGVVNTTVGVVDKTVGTVIDGATGVVNTVRPVVGGTLNAAGQVVGTVTGVVGGVVQGTSQVAQQYVGQAINGLGNVARSVLGQPGQGDFLNYKQEMPEFLQGMAVGNVQMVKARVTEYFYSLPENGGKITAGERRRFLLDMTHGVISDASALAVSSINKAIENNKKEITNLQSTAGKGESMIEIANSLVPVEMEKVKVLRGQNNNLATELKLAATETAMYLDEIGEETEEDNLAEAYEETEQMNEERDKKVDQTLSEVMQVKNQLEQKATENMPSDNEIEQETQGGEQ